MCGCYARRVLVEHRFPILDGTVGYVRKVQEARPFRLGLLGQVRSLHCWKTCWKTNERFDGLNEELVPGRDMEGGRCND